MNGSTRKTADREHAGRTDSAVDLQSLRTGRWYQAIRKVLRTGMTPKAVSRSSERVESARPRRRRFPNGQKWSFVPLGKDVPEPDLSGRSMPMRWSRGHLKTAC